MRCALLVVISLLLSTTARAHEFWLQPASFHPNAGTVLSVRLMHGERFNGDVVRRNQPYVRRFEFIGEGVSPVLGRHGAADSYVRLTEAGPGVIAYHSREVYSELDPERFEAYLAEERLDHIIEQRAALNESELPGREMYVRCATSLLRVGDCDSAASGQAAGLPLEIVLSSEGGVASAQVLFEGEPLPDTRVVAITQSDPSRLFELRTDSDGRVTLPSELGGVSMLTTLHMIRLSGRDDADWKSYWGSVTFEAVDARESADES